MGTGRPGRYLNTVGSRVRPSEFALVHSNEGTFKNSPIRGFTSASGGHGQKSIELLKKYGIEYNIVKIRPNGVRFGNIPNHAQIFKRTGCEQAWFPETWTERTILNAAEHVVALKSNANAPLGKAVFGTYKGVRVGVITNTPKGGGKPGIQTIFPDYDQSEKKNNRRKGK